MKKKKTCAESLKERETPKALKNVFLSMRKTFASAQHYSCVGFIAKAYNRNIAQHNTVFCVSLPAAMFLYNIMAMQAKHMWLLTRYKLLLDCLPKANLNRTIQWDIK